MKKLRFLFIIVFIVSISNILHANEKTKQVLILNSYHKGFPWTDNIVRGIESVIDTESKNIELIVEYMDTKAMGFGETYKIKLFDFLDYKYRNKNFDLIISSDDNAYNFLREFHDRLFPRTPIVVCGVNNTNAPDLVDPEQFTGVLESTSHEATIELILKLHPQTKKIYLIIDKTPSGKYRWRVTKPSFDRFKEIDFIRLSDDYTINEIEDILGKLENDSAVIFFTLYRDKSGRYLSLKEGASRVTKASARPVYTTHLLELPYGVVGGKVLGGFYHGQTVAKMGMRILNGESIKNIPFLLKSPTQYVFDYGQLDKWGIKHSDLPEGSLILNKPFSVYDTYKLHIWSGITTIIILIFIIVSLQTNIKKRKKAEELLKKQNYYLESSQALGKIGTWELDLINDILVWTDENCRIFGVPEGSVVNYEIFLNKVHPDDRDYVNRKWEAGVAGKPYDIEHRLLLNGEVKWVREKAEIEFDDGGKAISAIGFTQDITEKKQNENMLHESEERYRILFEQSPYGIVVFQPETSKFIEFNEQACKQLGYSRQEFSQLQIHDIEAKETVEETRVRIQKIAQSGYDNFNTLQRTKEGEYRHINVIAQLIEFSGHSVYYCIWRDITELMHLEERLRQAQKMESIGSLAGGIAHDFNNILFPIVGMSELLLEDLPKNSLEYENAKEILKAGKRGADLVQQILAFSRQSEHKMTPVRIQNILKEVLKLSRSTIPSNIEIQQNIQQSCGLVMADPIQIHQIAMNLITNASHAIEDESGIIDIELKEVVFKNADLDRGELQPGAYIKLSVSDNGIGMSQSTINKIFEPYFTTKEQGKGTGLGLAVVYGIIKEYKGEVIVHSEIGKGSTFNVYLPLMKKVNGIEQRIQSNSMPIGTERILLVDDEISVAKLESQMLSRLGYQVTVENDSNNALNRFKATPNSFDMVISDMTMPKMTGDHLAKEIMAIKDDIPVIICTGFSERINKETAKSIGVKGFLVKPVVKSDLAQMVRNVLDETKNS